MENDEELRRWEAERQARNREHEWRRRIRERAALLAVAAGVALALFVTIPVSQQMRDQAFGFDPGGGDRCVAADETGGGCSVWMTPQGEQRDHSEGQWYLMAGIGLAVLAGMGLFPLLITGVEQWWPPPRL